MRAAGDERVVRTSWRAALLVIAAIGVTEVILAWAVLNPRTFFNGDPGVKYLQAINLVESRWRRLSVRNPAERIDRDLQFSVLAGAQFDRRAPDAPFYGAYGELFTVPVSVSLAAFGMRGLYLVPLLASLGVMVLAYRLAARTAPCTAWLAPLLVGGCSPMLFYSVDLWEHTLAALLSTAGIFLFVAGTAVFSLWRFALAGLTLGAAITVREELYALVPASLAGLVWVERRRRLPAALAAGAGGLAVLSLHWAVKAMQTGRPARLAVWNLLAQSWSDDADGMRLRSLLSLLVPPGGGWLLLLAMLLAVRVWLPRAAPRWRAALVIALAAMLVLWASADALLVIHRWLRPDALVQAFPVVLFLLALPAAALARAGELQQVLAMAGVMTAAICVGGAISQGDVPLGGSQWGPRFLMPIYPLLTVAIVFAVMQRAAWVGHLQSAPHLLAVAFVGLVLAGAAVQAQGIRELLQAKASYERLLQATETAGAQGVVVTDLWWVPAVTAAEVYDLEMVLVDVPDTGSLPALLARLAEHGDTSLTLVSEGGGLGQRYAQALAQEGWVERARQSVRLWLPVDLVSYRRETSSN